MADYKGIKGFKVQYLSADPSDPIIGQTWYNRYFKGFKIYWCYRCRCLGNWWIIWVQQEDISAGCRNSNCRFSFWWL
jgi:hypothetical protein